MGHDVSECAVAYDDRRYYLFTTESTDLLTSYAGKMMTAHLSILIQK